MLYKALLLATAGLAVVISSCSVTQARELTFEERVQAQRAIEEVYWRHRIWPKDNPTPKPSLSEVLTDEAIRAKVEDYLKKSNALATWWQRPITGEQLQAELDRMARGTRDAEMLRELYAALGNDAAVIAETLARPTLVERLIRNWYAFDDRFHGAVKREAERALAGMGSVAEMKTLGGEYLERTFVRRGDDKGVPGETEDGIVELSAEEWREWTEDLARRFGTTPEAVPVQRMSGLQEDADRFFVTAVLSLEADEAVVGTVVWPKRAFDSWWSGERVGTSAEVVGELGIYALVAPMGGPCVDDAWESRYYVPSGRKGHTAVWTGTEMIVWGGYYLNTFLNTGGRYNPSTDSWTATSTGANVPSGGSGQAVWTGAEMIIWRGAGLNMSGRYNPLTDSWTAMSTRENVSSGAAVWTGTEMIVWGGIGGGRYNPSTDSWTAISGGANAPSTVGTVVWTGTEMIVWGGSGSNTNTGGRYDPSTDSWTATSTGANVPSARHGHTAVWTGTEMIVWGGLLNFSDSTGGRYDPSTDSWTATSTGANVPSGRRYHAAVWTGSEMIVWGGIRGSAGSPSPLNTGGRYNPWTDSWTPTSTGANVPYARGFHTAVWTGTEMIVWGGGGDSEGVPVFWLNTGGRYNPSTDSWTATSVNVPSARVYHTAVWTGSEMIVWGGITNIIFMTNTGARYNPSTDSWTATSTGLSVPSPRRYHTAVWTGTEMIVWGGGYAYLNTGGRYNPSTDGWAATSIDANVPSPRRYHTAVWTGTEMIVWGGYDGSPDISSLDTGGRYNPSTDSWTSTSTDANVPSARHFHTAVWTGTEMIVWGGGFYAYLNTGGRYNPSTDSWTATSTGANVPSPHSYHTAVWTGTEMIVWGGYSLDYYTSKTGGRYNPATDIWTATSTDANVPLPRKGHTAVWTGTEMIVWGGLDLDSFILNTGGRYNPATDIWTATSTDANVPLRRYYHTAVWTGTEMIIWGGASTVFQYYENPLDSTVGLYCASGCSPTPDTDGDGVGDVCDSAPLDPNVCRDFDADSCDDCTRGTVDPSNDGPDLDADGVCDAGDNCAAIANPAQTDTDANGEGDACDTDDDGDGVADGDDSVPLDHFVCQDNDADTCDDCASGTVNPTSDGLDTDGDGACNAGDPDDDGDGVADEEDPVPLDSHACWDLDTDGCDDCSSGSVDPATDGPDPDADGLCDLGDNCSGAFNPSQADLDHDGYGNACDNCILAPNDQADLDSDDRGDVCDNCASEFNPFQDDFDGDHVGDVCDNCYSVNNPNQSDLDEDLEGDPCDLDDGLIYLSFKIKNRLLWQDEEGYDSWNAYRGDLGVLLSDGTYTQEPGSNPLAAHQCGMLATSWQWVGAPAPGQTAFFLVTGEALGIEGDLGADSSDTPRPNDHPCP